MKFLIALALVFPLQSWSDCSQLLRGTGKSDHALLDRLSLSADMGSLMDRVRAYRRSKWQREEAIDQTPLKSLASGVRQEYKNAKNSLIVKWFFMISNSLLQGGVFALYNQPGSLVPVITAFSGLMMPVFILFPAHKRKKDTKLNMEKMLEMTSDRIKILRKEQYRFLMELPDHVISQVEEHFVKEWMPRIYGEEKESFVELSETERCYALNLGWISWVVKTERGYRFIDSFSRAEEGLDWLSRYLRFSDEVMLLAPEVQRFLEKKDWSDLPHEFNEQLEAPNWEVHSEFRLYSVVRAMLYFIY